MPTNALNAKTALVTGCAGFIGHHLVRRLKADGLWVRGVDIVYPKDRYGEFEGDSFFKLDLRNPTAAGHSLVRLPDKFDEIYMLAADVGGVGHIGGGHDAEIMTSNSLININSLRVFREFPERVGRVVFASSACVYGQVGLFRYDSDPPVHFADSEADMACREADAYPARCDFEYGWEKLYAERLCQAFAKDHGLNSAIARLHNCFGPEGSWNDGREKAPAAICRKIAELPPEGGTIEVWGDGTQRRSFTYVDDTIEGLTRLMRDANHFAGPVNIGSSRMIILFDLIYMVARIAGKYVQVRPTPGPTGVQARNSDNTLIREKLGWEPPDNLQSGLKATYEWISRQLNAPTLDLPASM
jgi:GDP-D-mannose 3', 5'-epimerase